MTCPSCAPRPDDGYYIKWTCGYKPHWWSAKCGMQIATYPTPESDRQAARAGHEALCAAHMETHR